MTQLWNPFAYSPTGQPLAPVAPPALRVLGREATGQQKVWAQQAFHAFADRARLSAAVHPKAQGQLPDGSPYEIQVIGALTIMSLWPVGGETAEYADSGILVIVDGVEQRYLLRPGNAGGLAVRPWKVTRVNWNQHADSSIGITTVPYFPRWTWHAPRGKEYLVAVEGSGLFRSGVDVLHLHTGGELSQQVPYVGYDVQIEGVRKWMAMHQPNNALVNSLVFPTSNTDPNAGNPLPYVRINPDVIPVREAVRVAPLAEYLGDAYMRRDGLRVRVPVRAYTDDGSGDVPPNTWFPVRLSPRRLSGVAVGSDSMVATIDFYLAGDPKNALTVEDYSFTGTAWAQEADVFTGDIGSCSPAFMEALQGPTANPFPYRKYLNWTATWPTLFAKESNSCVYDPFGDNVIGVFLSSSEIGPISYREWKTAVFNEGLGQESGVSSWFSHSGTPVLVVERSRSDINHELTGSTDRQNFEEWRCNPTDMTGPGGTVRRTKADSLSITIENFDERVLMIGTREFVAVRSQFSESWQTSSNSVFDLLVNTAVVSASGSVSTRVQSVRRNLFVVDPHLDLLCYTEVEYQYQVDQAATFNFTGTYTEWVGDVPSNLGTSTGATGILPDFVIPTPYFVIECRGQVQRFPMQYLTDDAARLALRREMRVTSTAGTFFQKDITDRGIDAAALAKSTSHTVAYAVDDLVTGLLATKPSLDPDEPRTSMLYTNLSFGVVSGLLSSNPGELSAQYAKDAKTGGAVLLLSTAQPDLAPGFPRAFAIDSRGARPLIDVLPEVALPDITSFGSA